MGRVRITTERIARHKQAEQHLMTMLRIRLRLQLSALHLPELLDRRDILVISVEKPEVLLMEHGSFAQLMTAESILES